MQFDAEASHHVSNTTNSGEQIEANNPLYYSFSNINENEQKIFATENEAKS